jgi:hypothetical protein
VAVAVATSPKQPLCPPLPCPGEPHASDTRRSSSGSRTGGGGSNKSGSSTGIGSCRKWRQLSPYPPHATPYLCLTSPCRRSSGSRSSCCFNTTNGGRSPLGACISGRRVRSNGGGLSTARKSWAEGSRKEPALRVIKLWKRKSGLKG